MQSQLSFFVSIAFSFIAWGIVTRRYIWPELRLRQAPGPLAQPEIPTTGPGNNLVPTSLQTPSPRIHS
jgi:hypothetical protein